MSSAKSVRLATPVATVLFVAAALFATGTPTAQAQTVGSIAGRGTCSTAGIEGISNQLVELQLCMFPDAFVELAHPNISVTSDRVHPVATAQTRDALYAAADKMALSVNSAFRVLTEQYVLYNSGACGAAAKPGRSNHQSGLAVDLANWSAAVKTMGNAGCSHPLPGSDPVHFDCPGPDMRAASVLVFQRLWNVNNPGDTIAEDGDFGPATAAKVAASPAGGFATNGCSMVGVPMTPAVWAAGVASSSVPFDETFDMVPGEVREITIDLMNTGANPWDGSVSLVTTSPRLRASVFADAGWISAENVAPVMGTVAPGASYRFKFTITAPMAPGHYDEHFALRQGADGWFADAGGPADNAMLLSIDVGGVFDTNRTPPRDIHGLDGGCAIAQGSRGAGPAWLAALVLAGLVLVTRRLRARRLSRE